MKHNVLSGMLIVLLFGVSGCGRVVDWGTELFDQGEDLPSLNAAARGYLRSCTIYDQLATAGMFDALWVSDEVRTLYTDAYARRRGKNDEFKKTFLRRQLEENRHFIMFYVLSPFELPLGEPHSQWQVFLKIGADVYYPVELKPAELEPEYIGFFGKKYSRFKAPYSIKFDAKNIDEKSILSPDDTLTLSFRSLEKQVLLTWQVGQSSTVIYGQEKSDCIKTENCQQ